MIEISVKGSNKRLSVTLNIRLVTFSGIITSKSNNTIKNLTN